MSLLPEAGKGLRLQLSHYCVLGSGPSGGKYWEHDGQLAIRQGGLAAFLPRATEEGATVLFQYFDNGREMAAGSEPVSHLGQVPAEQIAALRAALAELKARASHPRCEPRQRQVLEAFRLPDPEKDLELYRLYGSGSKRRLLVLWGVEKEAGSALPPLEAVSRVPQKAAGIGGGKMARLWVPVLLLAVLAAGGYGLLSQRKPAAAPVVLKQSPPPGREPTETLPAAPQAPALGTPSATPLASAKPTTMPANSPGLPSAPSDLPAGTAPALAPKEPAKKSGLAVSSTPPARGDAPWPADRPAKLKPSPTPASPPRAPVLAALPDEDVSAQTRANEAFMPPSAYMAAPSPVSLPTTSRKAEPPARNSDATPNRPPAGMPAARSQTPASRVPAEAKITSLEIISTRASGTPKDGRVEVLLNALARDESGAIGDAPSITEWRIDSTVQRSPGGQAIATATLPIALAKGTHRIGVTGTTRDGQVLQSEAEIEVSVKITEQSSVKVRPAGR